MQLHVLLISQILWIILIRNLQLNELTKSQLDNYDIHTILELELNQWITFRQREQQRKHCVEIQAKSHKMCLLLVEVHLEGEHGPAVIVDGENGGEWKEKDEEILSG